MIKRCDILMVTHRSADYLDLSLPRLLDSCGESDRVWIWHNGDDEATLDRLHTYRSDPRVERFYHSRENVRLRLPTVWLWTESKAQFVSKVDDDCIVADNWLSVLSSAHEANHGFGVIGSWRPYDEDFIPELAHHKIQTFDGGHQLLLNLWVQGSGYLLQRSAIARIGVLRKKESFTHYCIRLARHGAINGFYYPFIREDHMDDPRSAHSLIRTDAQLQSRLPLSAQANGIRTVEDWIKWQRRDAVILQTASLDLKDYSLLRRKMRLAKKKIRMLTGRPGQ